jgi:hypothetical protein
MSSATNSLTGQVTISDTLVQGDTYHKLTLIVQDLENTTRDFTGTTARMILTQCETTVFEDNSITLDVSTLGQVSFDLNLVPSVTTLFTVGAAVRGEIEYNFPFQIEGENVIRTLFLFNFKVVADTL